MRQPFSSFLDVSWSFAGRMRDDTDPPGRHQYPHRFHRRGGGEGNLGQRRLGSMPAQGPGRREVGDETRRFGRVFRPWRRRT
jgi:hypothetical protein